MNYKDIEEEFELDFGTIARSIWGYPFPLTKLVKLQEKILEINRNKFNQVIDEMISNKQDDREMREVEGRTFYEGYIFRDFELKEFKKNFNK